MIGLSSLPTCGVRAYSEVVAAALRECGVATGIHWLTKQPGLSVPASRREVKGWTRTMVDGLRRESPDVVVLQYSVFEYGYRGVPIHVRPMIRALRRLRTPIFVVLHEFAYPWGRRGVRGLVWALTQRLVLPLLVAAATRIVVTTEDRRSWILRRWYLPRRPVELFPVASNVPRVDVVQEQDKTVVGVFGYTVESSVARIVVEAVATASRAIHGLRLQLIGAPGQDSDAGRMWRRHASDRGVNLEFTGVVEAGELSAALTVAGLIIFPHEEGPTSRSTTLAAALLHGKAVVAFAGPQTWRALRDHHVVCLVQLDPIELGARISSLLLAPAAREAYEDRAAAWYQSKLSLSVLSHELKASLRETASCDASRRRWPFQ